MNRRLYFISVMIKGNLQVLNLKKKYKLMLRLIGDIVL